MGAIVGLDREKNYKRSSMYAEQQNRLCIERKLQLKRLEASFFSSGNEAGAPVPGFVAPREARQYNCDSGSIYYHFSADKNCIVLDYFWLTDGGGRARSKPVRPPPDFPRFYDVDRPLAARVHFREWVSTVFARLHDRPFGEFLRSRWAVHERLQYLIWHDQSSEYVRTDGRLEALADLIRLNGVVAGVPIADISHLPHWSLLRGHLDAPEQLRNEFARRIVFGELVCWLGTQSGIASARIPKYRILFGAPALDADAVRAELLSETKDVLSSIVVGSGRLSAASFRYMKCYALTDDELRSDDLALRLMRAEIIWNISRIISTEAKLNPVTAGARENATANDFRRFAQLADFVSLSQSYFGFDTSEADILVALQSRRGDVKQRYLNFDHVYRVASYEKAVSALVNQLEVSKDVNDEPPLDPIQKYDKLVGLLSDMLEDVDDKKDQLPVKT